MVARASEMAELLQLRETAEQIIQQGPISCYVSARTARNQLGIKTIPTRTWTWRSTTTSWRSCSTTWGRGCSKSAWIRSHTTRSEASVNPDIRNNSTAPKLPSFVEGKNLIDNFIQRFERYARANLWREENWAISQGAVLTCKALEAFTRVSEEEAMNCQEIKNALLRRYNLTEEGYHEKLRKCRPEPDETVDQLIFRSKPYLEKWVERANGDATFDGIKNFMIKEQVIYVCPRDLSIYLQERAPRTLDELNKIAEQY